MPQKVAMRHYGQRLERASPSFASHLGRSLSQEQALVAQEELPQLANSPPTARQGNHTDRGSLFLKRTREPCYSDTYIRQQRWWLHLHQRSFSIPRNKKILRFFVKFVIDVDQYPTSWAGVSHRQHEYGGLSSWQKESRTAKAVLKSPKAIASFRQSAGTAQLPLSRPKLLSTRQIARWLGHRYRQQLKTTSQKASFYTFKHWFRGGHRQYVRATMTTSKTV